METLQRKSNCQFVKGHTYIGNGGGWLQKGHTPWHKGKKICCNTGRTHFKKGCKPIYTFPKGKHPWNYKGGISDERHKFCGTEEYKQWRQSVYKRDFYHCKFCGTGGKAIRAHHIKEFKKYPELRLDLNNGITVCDTCHKIIHYKYVPTYPHVGTGKPIEW